MCQTPTPSQKHTLEKMAQAVNLSYKKENCVNIKKIIGSNEYLVLANMDTTDLSALQYFTNIKRLVLDGNNISDIEPLAHIKNIESINFGSNSIRLKSS